MYRIVHDTPDLAALSGPLRTVVEKCLSKDPAGRPAPDDVTAALAPHAARPDWLPGPVTTLIRATAAQARTFAATQGDTSPAPPAARPATRDRAPVHDRPTAPAVPRGTAHAPTQVDPPPHPGHGRRVLTYTAAVAAGLGVAALLVVLTRPGGGHHAGQDPPASAVPVSASSSATTSVSASACSATPALQNSDVTVAVYNATTRGGLAKSTSDQLAGRGFRVTEFGVYDGSETVPGTAVIDYGPAAVRQAAVLAREVPGARLTPSGRAGTTVDLVLGDDFTSLGPEPSPSAPACG